MSLLVLVSGTGGVEGGVWSELSQSQSQSRSSSSPDDGWGPF